jgi:hypothetical protein
MNLVIPGSARWGLALVLMGGCVARPGPGAPKAELKPRLLAGTWIGEVRSPRQAKIIWTIRSLWQLAVDGKGRIQGKVLRQQGLHTGYQGVLPCNKKPWALSTRRAPIKSGLLKAGKARTARFVLGTPKVGGHKGCAGVLPWSAQCAIRALPRGRLAVRCGGVKETLRRASLTGVWIWSEQRTDRAGDTRIWRQRYHFQQQGRAIRGFLDDTQVLKSNDGQRYRCNGRLMRSQQVRHALTGQVRGLTIQVTLRDKVKKRALCPGEEPPGPTLQGTWDPLQGTVVLEAENVRRTFKRLPGARPALKQAAR